MSLNRMQFLAGLAAALVMANLPVHGAQTEETDHAQHEHGPMQAVHAMHGGTMARDKGHQFEVVFQDDAMRVYPLDEGLSPEAVAQLNGRAFFLMPGAQAYSQPYPLQPEVDAKGQPTGSLGLRMDLSQMPAEGVKVMFQVWGYPAPAERSAQFSAPLAISDSKTIRYTPATQADQKLVMAQATCPVSGKDLGAMGGPLKLTRGTDTLFLCCQGCLGKVTANPDAYFEKTLTFSQPSKADQEAIAAQKTCPVSGKDLGAMGGPIKASLGEKSVFLCCPGCAPKVKASPEKFLAGAAPAEAQPTGGEAHHHEQ